VSEMSGKQDSLPKASHWVSRIAESWTPVLLASLSIRLNSKVPKFITKVSYRYICSASKYPAFWITNSQHLRYRFDGYNPRLVKAFVTGWPITFQSVCCCRSHGSSMFLLRPNGCSVLLGSGVTLHPFCATFPRTNKEHLRKN
jgi:hypothetical protein